MKRRRVMKLKSRVRITIKGIFLNLTYSAVFISACLIISIFFKETEKVHGAVNGDYRSKATGNWNATATWETFNGTSWVAAGSTPLSSAGTIDILSGHTVTLTSGITVD